MYFKRTLKTRRFSTNFTIHCCKIKNKFKKSLKNRFYNFYVTFYTYFVCSHLIGLIKNFFVFLPWNLQQKKNLLKASEPIGDADPLIACFFNCKVKIAVKKIRKLHVRLTNKNLPSVNARVLIHVTYVKSNTATYSGLIWTARIKLSFYMSIKIDELFNYNINWMLCRDLERCLYKTEIRYYRLNMVMAILNA